MPLLRNENRWLIKLGWEHLTQLYSESSCARNNLEFSTGLRGVQQMPLSRPRHRLTHATSWMALYSSPVYESSKVQNMTWSWFHSQAFQKRQNYNDGEVSGVVDWRRTAVAIKDISLGWENYSTLCLWWLCETQHAKTLSHTCKHARTICLSGTETKGSHPHSTQCRQRDAAPYSGYT